MLQLYTRDTPLVPKVLKDTPYTNVLRQMRQELDSVQASFRRQRGYAEATHPFVRLVKGALAKEGTFEEVIRKNTKYLTRKARSIGLTSPFFLGSVFEDVFMNNEIAYIGYVDRDYGPEEQMIMSSNWRNLACVSVRYNSCNDISMNLPGEYTNALQVHSYYTVDITKLAILFKGYSDYVEGYDLSLDIGKFVKEFMFIPMIPSLYNQALYARVTDSYDNYMVEEFEPDNIGYTKDLSGIYDRLSKKAYTPSRYANGFVGMANNVITTQRHSLSLFRLPDQAVTNVGLGLYTAMTSDVTRKLITQASKKTLRRDKSLLNAYKIHRKLMSSDGAAMRKLDPRIKSIYRDNNEQISERLDWRTT